MKRLALLLLTSTPVLLATLSGCGRGEPPPAPPRADWVLESRVAITESGSLYRAWGDWAAWGAAIAALAGLAGRILVDRRKRRE